MARLRPLSEHRDVHFGENSYDVRSWSVRTGADDEKVGEVHDLLLDDDARTRFLDVDLDDGRHVLIPSGDARVDPDDRTVRLAGLNRDGVRGLPEYDRRPDSLDEEYARSLTTAYDEAYVGDRHHERPEYSGAWAGRTGRTDRDRSGRLGRLDELDDVKVASGDPDPRGWEVVGADGHRIGRVDHLIGDTGTMKARYLTVDLDDEIASDRRILIPVGHVDLDRGDRRVLAAGIGRDTAGRMPAYEGGEVTRDYESRLGRQYDEGYTGDRYYDHPRYRSRQLDTERAGGERSGV